MTPKNPEISRPLTERLTELTSDLRRTQELAKGGLLPLERRSLAMLGELGLLHCRKEEAAVLPQEQSKVKAQAEALLGPYDEAVRATNASQGRGRHAITQGEQALQDLERHAPTLARQVVELAEEVERLRGLLTRVLPLSIPGGTLCRMCHQRLSPTRPHYPDCPVPAIEAALTPKEPRHDD